MQLWPESVGVEGASSDPGGFGMRSASSWGFLPTSGVCVRSSRRQGGCDLGGQVHSQTLSQPGEAPSPERPSGVHGEPWALGVPWLTWVPRLLAPAHLHPDSTLPPLLTRCFLSLARPGNSPVSRGLVCSCEQASVLGHHSQGRRGGGEEGRWGPRRGLGPGPQPPAPRTLDGGLSGGAPRTVALLLLRFLEPRPFPCSLERPGSPHVGDSHPRVSFWRPRTRAVSLRPRSRLLSA